ncbi:phosphate ABC transporter permease PstA [Bacillus horti]|uniref:Phosphate transport system permease protein PstA n=1 Tax=Caldalkalibacillus horti TaxID=77523 RepID=A0ABT9VT54_9BACI|nr:phosphate ABC transporter permease PstA [Bacillus horti]MDQ0164171.1 phosphate transport system permease protein [Bacillus horti]
MRAKQIDRVATVFFYLIAITIVGILVGLLGYIFVKGIPNLSWSFLTSAPEFMRAGGGVAPQLFNSFYILILTLLMVVPVGVGAGIYMSQYAPKNSVTDFLRTTIEVLSSIPSIVVGLFGLMLFVNMTGWGYTIIGGAMALAIFNLPLIVRVTEQALEAVPKDQTEASLALGVTKWETIWSVLLPAALPGIITGTILASGRIFGEAAALLYTSGMSSPSLDFTNWNPFELTSPLNIFRSGSTLSVHIWKINSEGLIPDAREIANGASALLVLAVLVFNLGARWLGKWIHKRLTSS